MPNIKINDIDYDLNMLSEKAQTQVRNIRFVDQELSRLRAQSAVLQTARMSYASALLQALPASINAGETITLN